MLNHCPPHDSRNAVRRAFTLVEMLVAVALVLLMMTMFAEIFSLATGTMSKQKGLAELDQRQRMATTLLRADIRDRTFKTVYAFHPADDPIFVASRNRPINIPFENRLGYLFIAENDPENDLDDVLQLTVTRTDGSLFYGRVKPLLDKYGNGPNSNPNQPDYDDGDIGLSLAGNEIGTSPTAEIAYFVRNGILYRRVLLVRKTLTSDFEDRPTTPLVMGLSENLVQPGIYPTGTTTYVAGATTFPNDFSYSATYVFSGMSGSLEFIGQRSLSNVLSGGSPVALGRPENRFGFRPTTGTPMEFLPTGQFIGRFTQEETSHVDFAWPGNPGVGSDGTIGTGDDTNPYTRQTGLTLSPNGVVTAYTHVPGADDRSGEDIMLTNVECFDVKIWDIRGGVGADGQPGVASVNDNGPSGPTDEVAELGWPNSDDGAWVDIGHGGAFGFFAQGNNRNPSHGSFASNNRCFDTWHPALGPKVAPLSRLPPFRPALVGPDGAPGQQGDGVPGGVGDDDGDGVDDNIEELGWPNTDDVPIPLKAIQIRLRYKDVSTGAVRDVTIVESLQ